MTTPRFVEYIYLLSQNLQYQFWNSKIQNVPDKESKHNVYMNQVGHFILYTYI